MENIDYLIDRYVDAKEIVINEGYDHEIDWQQGVLFSKSNECDFLRESAWVILSSGMKEKVIRKLFPQISAAFFGFIDAKSIAGNADKCRSVAMNAFRHEAKINAIINIAVRIAEESFGRVKELIDRFGINYLQTFDFIGPVTSYHLAKNIGLEVAKPDRHLVRVAGVFGYNCVNEFCKHISQVTGDSISVVDLVIWRFATLRRDYCSWFRSSI